MYKNWHIGAQLEPYGCELRRAQARAPKQVQDPKHGRGVRTAAAEAPAHRNPLPNPDLRALAHPASGLEGQRRAHAKILSRRNVLRPCKALDMTVGGDLDLKLINPVQQLKDGLQVMVTIAAAAGHVQKEIELRRRRPPRPGPGEQPIRHRRQGSCQFDSCNFTLTSPRCNATRRGNHRPAACWYSP